MLGIADLANVYRGRRVLVTGHTGFKGSWLALWLTEIGAHVTGISLAPPSDPNHWDLLQLDIDEHRIDIRDGDAVMRAVMSAQPHCVLHLAAQPLVRRSYGTPVDTWSTNVMGTVDLLEACRASSSIRTIIVATTDKCYENNESRGAYREDDRLGGHDPYSASKAATELVAASYRTAFMGTSQSPLLATVRAGNVIGGGDWGEDRLIPDLVRAQASETTLAVRSPNATRPWQHVLDCLAGYLLLGANLLAGKREFGRAWNFGPNVDNTLTVTEMLAKLQAGWPGLRWYNDDSHGPRESSMLSLDSTRARTLLGWRPVWSIDEALAKTALWYRRFLENGAVSSREQLAEYVAAAQKAFPRLATP
jgi:CDP-glucose 4,6-dehydratase